MNAWTGGCLAISSATRSARQMGWTAIENGALLALASQQFDVFVTVDRNLAFQQNLAALPIAAPPTEAVDGPRGYQAGLTVIGD